MTSNESLIKSTTEAIEKLEQVINTIALLPLKERVEKYKIDPLIRSVQSIRDFQYSVVPELRPPLEESDSEFPLTDEQAMNVSKLNNEDIEKIDNFLLLNASTKWHKVARIVGTTMVEMPNRRVGVPDIFYAQRVRFLVESGKLESRGDLSRMGYSEVRLPSNET